ncbi:Gfo/Idh/MocA family oxidoreductase [Pelagicoccus enzymogenes]|uniref:Gfo/Idh/MocA family protein n=1 Tax=Pelagicoccus enzymogenes TaxID=2773457 RepID=UPI00280E00BD|nr:Gfo/Idh/MocA family oxidoreductase [Pelagicoccus enzymogenes]MDQ8201071.1 Gfo/Idh/MocA family oxidoreductase [Pelagicoccus enzymogenes]
MMTSTTSSSPRVALVGVAGYAGVYFEWLSEAHRNGLVHLAAATILPAERQLPAALELEHLADKTYDCYEAMFEAEAGKIDLCFIPTGIPWHAPMAIAAMEAGANVLVEKPLAGSDADVRRVIAAEKQCKRWVAVGFQDMYTSELMELKQSLLNGIIGQIQSVSMLGLWPRSTAYYRRNAWAGKRELNGRSVMDSPLNNAFAHHVNLCLFLAGDTVSSSAAATVVSSNLFRAHDIENFDTAVVSAASSDNGVAFWFGVTHACFETVEPRIRIRGERGSVEWERQGVCTIRPDDQDPVSIEVPQYSKSRQNMFEQVVSRLSDSNSFICDSQIAQSHAALIESIQRGADVKTVHSSNIETIKSDSDGHTIPAIKDINLLLQRTFETNSPLEDLSKKAVHLKQ